MVCFNSEPDPGGAQARMPLVRDEGPVGLIICPSRELARQTYEVACEFCDPLAAAGMPRLRNMLCIGGIDTRVQCEPLKARRAPPAPQGRPSTWPSGVLWLRLLWICASA